MGYLDRLWWSPDDDTDDDEDTHRCTDRKVVERGDWVPRYGPIAVDDGIAVTFQQQVVIECQDCGEKQDGFDLTTEERRVVEYDTINRYPTDTDCDVELDGYARGTLQIRDVEGIGDEEP